MTLNFSGTEFELSEHATPLKVNTLLSRNACQSLEKINNIFQQEYQFEDSLLKIYALF